MALCYSHSGTVFMKVTMMVIPTIDSLSSTREDVQGLT